MQLNWLAILASAIASMIIGSVWFGPLFGKMYISLMGMDKLSSEEQAKMKKSMMMTYVWQFIASVVTFIVLDRFIINLHITSLSGAVITALFAWIGFMIPIQLGQALWGGKMKLFWLGAGNSLLTMVAAGLILGTWK
jgi:hypothetical protein